MFVILVLVGLLVVLIGAAAWIDLRAAGRWRRLTIDRAALREARRDARLARELPDVIVRFPGRDPGGS